MIFTAKQLAEIFVAQPFLAVRFSSNHACTKNFRSKLSRIP